ncbi:F-BAR domain only protein 2-like isoform X4 [Amblyraja radiata]|uniref:F-BAR domain only protein 2-like isoform X4 n=1 Tax=Amblyraja radiata TaxID=386614 RepID=UPI0014020894|nr:F-BAR domain only protein 2-like isoform X4 [Amblyraja radiata]
MQHFGGNFWGEKNNGFDVLYHNMKHGQVSVKELADFVRERALIEESYSKSMAKLSKMVSTNGTLGTFAPMWEVFRISVDKLALCHLELVRKLHDLIKEMNRFNEEQAKVHRKTKEEVSGTLEAVQNMQSSVQLLQKCKDNYHSKWLEWDRLKKDRATQKEVDKAELKSKKAAKSYKASMEKYHCTRSDYQQQMAEAAQKFQQIEENHLRHMKVLIKSYSNSIEDTHVQLGQVHEEFKQNAENIRVQDLIQKYALTKGTGKDKPGPIEFEECNTEVVLEASKKSKRKSFVIPGLSKREKDTDSTGSPDPDSINSPEVDEEGYTIRPDVAQNYEKGHRPCCSSDSDTDSDEPRRFHVEIKPATVKDRSGDHETSVELLKASIGNIVLSSNPMILTKKNSTKHTIQLAPLSVDGNSEGTHARAADVEMSAYQFTAPSSELNSRPAISQNGISFLDPLFGASAEAMFDKFNLPGPTNVQADASVGKATVVALPRRHSRKKLLPLQLESADVSRSVSPTATSPQSPSAAASSLADEAATTQTSRSRATTPAACISRGPSPVTFGCHDALPVAAAFTECIDAYFKGGDFTNVIVKLTGDVTMSFPAGIVRIFSGNPSPAVVSFRLLNANRISHFLPHSQLLYSDLSQSDSYVKDFWLNMPALTAQLQKQAAENPNASYFNISLLKYQVSAADCPAAPLRVAARWKCETARTEVAMDYQYAGESTSMVLHNLHALLPLEGAVRNIHSHPPAAWNSKQKRLRWKLPDISALSETEGKGALCASWEVSDGPNKPLPLALQFTSEGSTMSGADVRLVGTAYRLSLVKKKLVTGKYFAGC